MSVEFRVYGLPIAQGSKTPWGTESAKGLKSWRQDVAVVARNAMNDQGLPTSEPVIVVAEFVFPRPKHHYGSGRNAETLKPSAPTWVAKKPDLDKLLRALADALTGVVYRDDSQIVSSAVSKVFGAHPGAKVSIRTVEHHPQEVIPSLST